METSSNGMAWYDEVWPAAACLCLAWYDEVWLGEAKVMDKILWLVEVEDEGSASKGMGNKRAA